MPHHSTAAQAVYSEIVNAPGYRVGIDGSVWSYRSGSWKRLKPDRRKEDQRKRYKIRLASGEYRRSYGSHFVLEAFIGPRPNNMEACHEDGDCTNDALSNLRWDGHSANLLDRRRHGTNVQGEMVNTAKLITADVLEIRRIGKPLKQHALRYGVSESLISAILKRKVWQHVN